MRLLGVGPLRFHSGELGRRSTSASDTCIVHLKCHIDIGWSPDFVTRYNCILIV